MKTGQFKDRIDILNYSTTNYADGSTDAETRVDKSVWARVIPMSGRRGLEGNQETIDIDYEIWLHYNDYPQLSKRNQIGFKLRTFTIHSLIIVEERQTIFKLKVKEDGANDLYLYDENLENITDENIDDITV